MDLASTEEVIQARGVVSSNLLFQNLLAHYEAGTVWSDELQNRLVLLWHNNPHSPEVKRLYVQILIKTRGTNVGWSELCHLLRNDLIPMLPYEFDLYLQLAQCASKLHNYHEARNALLTGSGLLESMPHDKKVAHEFEHRLGVLYLSTNEFTLAEKHLLKAQTLHEHNPHNLNALGVLYNEKRNLREACMYYRAAIACGVVESTPDYLMNLGLALCHTRQFAESRACYDQALALRPDFTLVFQNRLLDGFYALGKRELSHSGQLELLHEHQLINKFYPNQTKTRPKPLIKADGTPRVLGFVGGDFIGHPVAFFMKSILQYVDRKRFEVVIYNTKALPLSMSTEEASRHFLGHRHRCIKDVPTNQVVEYIQNDQVDVLYDLSTHTGNNRIDVFASRAAPCQVSYLGYPGTSGLLSMDYHLVGKLTDSPRNQDYYSEKLIRLPSMHNWSLPHPFVEEMFPLVERSVDEVVYGSFCRLNKLNSRVLGVWSAILEKAPTSRLFLKPKELFSGDGEQELLQDFSPHVRDRVVFLPYQDDYVAHMAQYNAIDVALDPFPYAGTTTTCDALYMGTPSVTLWHGSGCHVHNVSSALMNYCQLTRYVCYNDQDYIDTAVTFGAKRPRPSKAEIRQAFKKSPLWGCRAFVSSFEEAAVAMIEDDAESDA